jgi:hypothetical protein
MFFFSNSLVFIPSGIETMIIHSEVKYYATDILFEDYAFSFHGYISFHNDDNSPQGEISSPVICFILERM